MKIKITYKEIEFDIEFQYQPLEKADSGVEAQYPGCPESVYIEEIIHKGSNFYDILENDFEELEKLILENL